MTKDRMIARIAEINNELNNTPRPKLGVDSIEDVDDLYQARLEYNWWVDEMEEEKHTLEESLSMCGVK